MFLTSLALSQTTVTVALTDLRRLYSAALSFVASAVSSVNQIESTQVTKARRNQIVEELTNISRAISGIRSDNEILIVDFTDYLDKVKAGQWSNAERDQSWRQISRSMSKVKTAVITTVKLVEESGSLHVALTAEDRLALRETLNSRSLILDRLISLPPPGAVAEIDQLDRMNKLYTRLVKSLGELNTALTRAVDRLSKE